MWRWRRGSGAAGQLVLLFAISVASRVEAQSLSSPDWVITGGGGFVFRQVRSGSPGALLRLGRVIRLGSAVYLEPGLTWHGYLRSGWWWGEDSPCPESGCGEEPQDALSIIGVEIGAAYRKSGAENPVYPVAGVGLYRAAASDTSETGLGANLGLVIPFRRSGFGPALEIRYYRIFGDSRFKSILLPIALRWSF
jgi:hypothetical protein